jgi:hypothetical protein
MAAPHDQGNEASGRRFGICVVNAGVISSSNVFPKQISLISKQN